MVYAQCSDSVIIGTFYLTILQSASFTAIVNNNPFSTKLRQLQWSYILIYHIIISDKTVYINFKTLLNLTVRFSFTNYVKAYTCRSQFYK